MPPAPHAVPRRRAALVLAAVVLAAAWPFVLTSPAALRTGVQVVALLLVGLSLTVMVGWLRVITLFAPAAAAAGAAAAAALLVRAHPLLALVAAAGAGAVTGLVALAAAAGHPRRWLPVTSLAVTVAGVMLVPRLVVRPLAPPTLFGLSLAHERVLYLVGLVLAAAACLLLDVLRRGQVGARLVAAGTSTGNEPSAPRWWALGVALSGALAGGAGYLTTLLHQGLPSPLEFAPTTAVAYLAIPVVGGAATVGGAVVGAGVFLGAARLSLALSLAAVTVPTGLLVVVAASGRGGLMPWVTTGRPHVLWDRSWTAWRSLRDRGGRHR